MRLEEPRYLRIIIARTVSRDLISQPYPPPGLMEGQSLVRTWRTGGTLTAGGLRRPRLSSSWLGRTGRESRFWVEYPAAATACSLVEREGRDRGKNYTRSWFQSNIAQCGRRPGRRGMVCHPHTAAVGAYGGPPRTGLAISCHTLNAAINFVVLFSPVSDLCFFCLIR